MNLKVINILGLGVMGRQIAALFQLLGYKVCVWDHAFTEQKEKLFVLEVKKLDKVFKLADVLRIDPTFVEDISRLEPALTYEVLLEDLDVKRSVLSSLSYPVGFGRLLTNTSSYSPSEIHPEAIGFHLFNPISILRFAEITREPADLGAEARLLAEQLKNRLGFDFIITKENRGYIGNYLLFYEIANAFKLIDLYGYDTNSIDQVLKHMGRVISLFDIIDLVGVDVTRKIIMNLKEMDASIYYSPIFDQAIEKGVLGRKNKTSLRTLINKEG